MCFQKSTDSRLVFFQPLNKRSMLVRLIYTSDIPKKDFFTHWGLVGVTPKGRRGPFPGRELRSGGIREEEEETVWPGRKIGGVFDRFSGQRGAKGFEMALGGR